MIPALVAAMQDRALRGNPREVYLWMHEHLDTLQYRIVKHSVVEAALGLSDSSVGAAIARLVERGYLDRGERRGRLTSYRLFHSRATLTEPVIPR